MKKNYYKNEVFKLHKDQRIVIEKINKKEYEKFLTIGEEYQITTRIASMLWLWCNREEKMVNCSEIEYKLVYYSNKLRRMEEYTFELFDSFVLVAGKKVAVKQWRIKFKNVDEVITPSMYSFKFLKEINDRIVNDTIQMPILYAVFSVTSEDVDYGVGETTELIGIFDKETADMIMSQKPNDELIEYSMFEIAIGRDYRTAGGGMPQINSCAYYE